MAAYKIEFYESYGISHCGSEGDYVARTVELSDEEVDTLVQLIKEKGTSDVEALGLRESHPDIYDTLDEAYREAAMDAAEMHWLWEGYYNGYFNYDLKEVMDYCKEHLGFVYEKEENDEEDDEEEYENDEGYDDDECDAFYEWKDNYVHNVLKTDDEIRDFFYNVLNADLSIEDLYDYTVEIPEEIVLKAEEE